MIMVRTFTKVPHFGLVAFKLDEIIHRERTIVKQRSQVFLVANPAVKGQIKALQNRVQFGGLIVNSSVYDRPSNTSPPSCSSRLWINFKGQKPQQVFF